MVKPPTGLIEMVIIFVGNIALVMLEFTLYTEPKFMAVSVGYSFIIARVTSAGQEQPTQHHALLGNTSQPGALRPAFHARGGSTARSWTAAGRGHSQCDRSACSGSWE